MVNHWLIYLTQVICWLCWVSRPICPFITRVLIESHRQKAKILNGLLAINDLGAMLAQG